jgi:hypothetical protein
MLFPDTRASGAPILAQAVGVEKVTEISRVRFSESMLERVILLPCTQQPSPANVLA